MNAMEQLIQENQAIKERLYAVHALGLPQVADVLRNHLNVLDLDVYEHRARLQGEVSQHREALQLANTELDARNRDLEGERAAYGRLRAFAVALWGKLHDPAKEPFPDKEPFPEV